MDDDAIFERRHLARYTLGDADLEREVLDLFVAQLPQSLDALASADSPDAWRRAAHTIKGSARAVGAWRLATAAEAAEQVPDRPQEWRRQIEAVGRAVAEVRTHVAVCEPV